jgi:hypothetical protein
MRCKVSMLIDGKPDACQGSVPFRISQIAQVTPMARIINAIFWFGVWLAELKEVLKCGSAEAIMAKINALAQAS